jgi:hypothetical protein
LQKKEEESMKSAWLVTWEWNGDHAEKNEDEKIVSILNYRYSDRRIKEYIEQAYIDSEYLLSDKLSCAKNIKCNPYRPSMEGLKIVCGHNPHLLARKVENIKLVKGVDGKEQLIWEEIPFRKPIKLQKN